MPENAPRVKLEATRGYGAEVVTYRKDEDREVVAQRLAAERGMVTIPPFKPSGTSWRAKAPPPRSCSRMPGRSTCSSCPAAARACSRLRDRGAPSRANCHVVGVSPPPATM